MKLEKVTINTFIDAWFNEDYTNLSKEDFHIVYAEYIDVSGLYRSKEFELYSYINYLENRIHMAKVLVTSQLLFLDTFKVPYIEGLQMFEKIGNKITWDGNEKNFRSQMKRVYSNIRINSTELSENTSNLKKLKKQKQVKIKQLFNQGMSLSKL